MALKRRAFPAPVEKVARRDHPNPPRRALQRVRLEVVRELRQRDEVALQEPPQALSHHEDQRAGDPAVRVRLEEPPDADHRHLALVRDVCQHLLRLLHEGRIDELLAERLVHSKETPLFF